MDDPQTPVIVVPKAYKEKIFLCLKKQKLLHKKLKSFPLPPHPSLPQLQRFSPPPSSPPSQENEKTIHFFVLPLVESSSLEQLQPVLESLLPPSTNLSDLFLHVPRSLFTTSSPKKPPPQSFSLSLLQYCRSLVQGGEGGEGEGEGESLWGWVEKLGGWFGHKYEMLGDIVIYRQNGELDEILGSCPSSPSPSSSSLGEEWMKQIATQIPVLLPRINTVLLQTGAIKGELRTPEDMKILFTTKQNEEKSVITTATVRENGFLYSLDVALIMFSSGNGTEKKRMITIDVTDQVVIDMFAGIGYFVIPLVASKLPPPLSKKQKEQLKKKEKEGEGGGEQPPPPNRMVKKLVAIEKNPNSFEYLKKNLVLNNISDYVVPLLGDNREVGEEWVGKADRVHMGYFPGTEVFLSRAFDFLREDKGGMVHYHHLCRKSEYETMALEHFMDVIFPSSSSRPSIEGLFQVVNFITVKSYSPHVYHCVADVFVSPLALEKYKNHK